MELSIDFYKEEEEELEEEVFRSEISSIMDLSNVVPGEIELEDEIKMGYLRMKYKKTL